MTSKGLMGLPRRQLCFRSITEGESLSWLKLECFRHSETDELHLWITAIQGSMQQMLNKSCKLVWVNSGSWWWTGRPGVLRFTGSQRVGYDWATELNWTEVFLGHTAVLFNFLRKCCTVFQSYCTVLHSQQQCTGVPIPLHPCQCSLKHKGF